MFQYNRKNRGVLPRTDRRRETAWSGSSSRRRTGGSLARQVSLGRGEEGAAVEGAELTNGQDGSV